MYESFFDLSSRPFSAAPVVQQYFPTAVVEQARQTLVRIVDRAEGPGLIIGQPGLGKTLLLRMLDHHFQHVFHCIHLASAAIESRKDLLQNVLFELNLPYREMEEGELRLSLLDFLRPSENCPHGVLLLVDEAHTLPLQLLDEIRMITNLVRDGQPRVRLILAGDNQLDDIFADPRLDSFNQRIAARCYLEALNQEQTAEYVRAQVTTSGGDPSGIFTADALVAIHRASGGIPRLINQVCDHALVMASLGGYQQLDGTGIEEAWSDLQQLPGPWNDAPAPTNGQGESIVEFGSLDSHEAEETTPADVPVDPPTIAINADRNDLPEPADAADAIGAAPSIVDHTPDESQSAFASAGTVNVESRLETSPQPGAAGDVPVTGRSPDLGWANSPAANYSIHKLDPNDHGEPTSPTEDPGANYYASNVVQVGWEADSAEDIDTRGQRPDLAPVASPQAQVTEVPSVAAAAQESPAAADATPTHATTAEFVDPFGHDFEEEEVVVDRYADLGATVFSGCPRVASEEGRALAALIDQQPGPQLSVVNANSVADNEVEGPVNEPAAVTAPTAPGPESPGRHQPMEVDRQANGEELASTDEIAAQALVTNVFDTSSLSDWLFEPAANAGIEPVRQSDDSIEGIQAKPAGLVAEPAEATCEVAADSSASSDHATDDLAGDVHIEAAVEVREHAPHGPTGSLDGTEPQPSFLQMHHAPNFNDDRDMIVIDQDKTDGVFLTQTGDDLARRVEYQQLFSQLREG